MAPQCQWQPNFHSTILKKDDTWKCRGQEVSINKGRGTCNWITKRWQIAQCCTSSFPVSSTTREELGLKNLFPSPMTEMMIKEQCCSSSISTCFTVSSTTRTTRQEVGSKNLFPSPMTEMMIKEQCCSSSISTCFTVSSTREEVAGARLKSQRGDHQSQVLNENGWKVRRIIETEMEMMREVAAVRAKAFCQPVPFSKYLLFQAEELSRVVYRLKNYPPDRYACLVAEASSETPEVEQEVLGVVDATVYRDDVLQYLPGATAYVYISGMAVLNKFRRQKVATALLKACDVLARFWGFEYLVLRAYEDDFGARDLYTNAGYKVVSADAPWKTKWIGRRKRVLMVKQVSQEST